MATQTDDITLRCVLNKVRNSNFGGGDVPKFEPTCPEQSRRKTWLKFKDLDTSIQKLRAIYKIHPEWFEVPKPKSDKGQNIIDYSIS
ncbi:MAG: hypothetical protein Q7S11_04575 [bacterium]|nr:hypothetical protein [bacterium]